MLIKEYRIPMPLSVEEYRIAQLYMIQKKSREESKGKDSGVEIIKNEPYEEGPGGSGQYTQKRYHISSHVPGWVLPILPKDSLIVIEEAWNAYPYTKTRFSCPLVEKFMIEMETLYYNDDGCQENVFSLNAQQRKNIKVDLIDIVKEQSTDYVKAEDPKFYVSSKSHRGPLDDNWLDNISKQPNTSVMCAYKICKVEFKYWGMQTKMEKFVHDVALRKTMLRAHKQAWCWQDEWFGLDMEDIRKLEHETQLSLKRKFEQMNSPNQQDSGVVDSTCSLKNAVSITSIHEKVAGGPAAMLRRNSNHSLLSVTSRRSQLSESLRIEGLRRDSVDTTSSSSEYFDAYDESPAFSDDDDDDVMGGDVGDDIKSSQADPLGDAANIKMYEKDMMTVPSGGSKSKFSILVLVLHGGNGHFDTCGEVGDKISSCKQNDLQTMQSTFENVISRHYKAAANRMAFRLVPCPSDIITATHQLLNKLNPNLNDMEENSTIVTSSLISLFAIHSRDYQQCIQSLAHRCNFVYDNFLLSPEGYGFNGKVCLIADTIGSVMGYDLLSSYARPMTPNLTISQETFHSMNDGDDSSSDVTPIHIPPGNASGGKPPRLKLFTNHQQQPHASMSASSVGASSRPRRSCTSECDELFSPLPEAATASKKSRSTTECPSEMKRKCANFVGSFSTDEIENVKSNETNLEEVNLDDFLNFDICEYFMLGSPLAIVLAMRHLNKPQDKLLPRGPACQQIYNVFYSSDPSSARVEPFIDERFSQIPSIKVPNFRYSPYGDEQPTAIGETMLNYSHHFSSNDSPTSTTQRMDYYDRQSSLLVRSATEGDSMRIDSDTTSVYAASYNKDISDVVACWWGSKRIDYSLFSPEEALSSFTHLSLAHLFHASFWESTDFAAFVLRQIFHQESPANNLYELEEHRKNEISFTPDLVREKWKHKRTYFKIRNIADNHRSKDVLAVEGGPQILHGRFNYGPLDMVSLNDEVVDTFVLMPSMEWRRITSDLTNNHGKISYTIPTDDHFQRGFYQIRMVVKGDLTYTDNYLAVLPPQLECVVFSIDGSFITNLSIMANDPKVRPSAVDVVRRWQDMGYMILYVTARLDIQKNRVVTWLAQHNFPQGMIWFCDTLSHDPLGHKTMLLKNLQKDYCLQYAAAYGSAKDVAVYSQLKIQPSRIYIVGKPKKQATNCTWLVKGYSMHLDDLARPEFLAPAKVDAKEILGRRCFRLPLRSSRKSKRAASGGDAS